MKIRSKAALALAALLVFAVAGLSQLSVAQDDVAHFVSGVVKHVDKGTKTMVVKTADGTEHTVKWTGKTSWEGTKESGKGIKEGSEVSVKYSEKGGEKTADAVKVAGKDTGKALSQYVSLRSSIQFRPRYALGLSCAVHRRRRATLMRVLQEFNHDAESAALP